MARLRRSTRKPHEARRVGAESPGEHAARDEQAVLDESDETVPAPDEPASDGDESAEGTALPAPGDPDSEEEAPEWADSAAADPAPIPKGRAATRPPTANVSGSSIGRAVARYPLALALPVSLLLFGAIALGLTRAPTYKSTASLSVGKLDIGTQAVPGYVTAATNLASAYSRVVESQQILVPTAARLGTSYLSIADRVSATPVPDSPVFRITGEASSARQAVVLTQAVSDSITAYVKRVGQSEGGADAVLARYRTAAVRADRLRVKLGRARAALTGGNTPRAILRRFENAKVAAQTADLQVQTLANAYGNSIQNSQGALVTVLDTPSHAVSDRASVLQRLAFIGFFGGLVIGLGLAVMLERRAARRIR